MEDREEQIAIAIQTLEKQADDYVLHNNLTKDFFCRFDDKKDYVLQFREDDNVVYPTCVPIGIEQQGSVPMHHTQATNECQKLQYQQEQQDLPKTKEQWVAQRMATLGRLSEVNLRITKFKEILDQFFQMDEQQKKTFLSYLTKEDEAIEKHMKDMQRVIREVHGDLTRCSQTLYSEHNNAILKMTTSVCEPLDTILKSIESVLYPRMMSIEKSFAKATTNQKYDTWKGVALAIWEKVSTMLRWLLKGVNSLISKISSYLFTYSKKAMLRFARYAGQEFISVKRALCETSVPKDRLMYYRYLDLVIRRLVLLNPTVKASIRDKLRSLCSKHEQNLISFLKTSAQQLVDNARNETKLNLGTKKEDNDTIMRDFELEAKQFKKLIETQNKAIGGGLCGGIVLIHDDGLSDDRIIALLWMICVTSMQTISQFFVDLLAKPIGYACDETNFLTASKPIQKEELDDNPDDVEIQNDAIDDQDMNIEMEQVPRFEDSIRETLTTGFKTALKKGVTSAKETLTLEKLTTLFGKIGGKGKEAGAVMISKMGSIIQVLFDFFWYFTEHNFLPTKDMENKILDCYAPPTDEKNYKKWMDETWKRFENPTVIHRIPDYVRYAYCKAQGNEPDVCYDLVKLNQPLIGLAEPELRYEKYIEQTKKQQQAEHEKQSDAILQNPEDIDETIQKIFKETGFSERTEQDESLALAKKLFQDQQSKMDKAILKNPLPTSKVAKDVSRGLKVGDTLPGSNITVPSAKVTTLPGSNVTVPSAKANPPIIPVVKVALPRKLAPVTTTRPSATAGIAVKTLNGRTPK